MLSRRHVIALSAAQIAAPALFIRAAQAGAYPDRPVRLLVPVAAGGPTDLVARMLAEKLSQMWGQKVVVENRGGAGTNIGNEMIARSTPDGYSLLFATASLAVNASLYRSLSYDAIADFAPVSLATTLPYFAFVPNSSKAHSIKDLIALAKANPGKMTLASPGTGSAPHLAGALFLQMAKIEMTHVPYRGAAPALNDLIPGRVDCYFGSGALLSNWRSGQLRALATTGAKSDPAAPELPPIAEAGVPGYEVIGWQAVFAPAKTPPAIVQKLSADITKALADPPIKDKLAKSGYVCGGSSPEEMGKLLKDEIDKWSGVIKSVGIKIN
jgi:tripartite-type tricarboxylate transporter receptor subunit TctC